MGDLEGDVELRATNGDEHEKPVDMVSVEKAWEDQVQVSCLLPGGETVQNLRLSSCFEKPVKPPMDLPSQIALQVPYTRTFMHGELAKGFPKRKTNKINTSKYNPWTFVPLAAGLQFRRFTNAFYLVILILAMAGTYGDNLWTVSYSPATLIVLILFVVCVALIFEGRDDWERHENDRRENGKEIERIRNNEIEVTTWGKLMPGDMVFVNDRSSVPADLLLVASYGADKAGSMCYVETSGIDGETNLKIKSVPMHLVASIGKNAQLKSLVSSARQSSSKLRRQSSTLEKLSSTKKAMAQLVANIAGGAYLYEEPNAFLSFNGTHTNRGSTKKNLLEFNNVVLRGSQVRNTKWILGIVMYAGPETKLALSRKPTPAKLGLVDIFMNKILLIVAILYFVLVIVADLVLFLAIDDTTDWWYFDFTSSTNSFAVPGPVAFFFTYAILFANFIPVPIIIAVEVCNFYAKAMIEWDIEMYHKETNSAAKCQTTNLVAEIGQITHIFSDKTGTLTRNQMKMVGCYVNGRMHGSIPPEIDADGEGVDFGDASSAATGSPRGMEHGKKVESMRMDAAAGEEADSETPLLITSVDESLAAQSPSHERNSHDAVTIALPPTDQVTPMNDERRSSQKMNQDSGSDDGSDDGSAASLRSLKIEEVFEDTIDLLADENPPAAKVEEREALFRYFVLLAVCHTVVIDYDTSGNIVFNAESPDEEAFVKCAAALGIKLESTEEGIVTISTPSGNERKYKVLGLNPFNSTRKRMSLIVQCLTNKKIFLMMKGADNVMLERMRAPTTPEEKNAAAELDEVLRRYSWAGLRTLVMGQREIPEDEFLAWDKKRTEAVLGPPAERPELLTELAASVESNVEFMGASAIEDQLQLGVPEAVQTLRDSGAQVWVLTGDKVETAINIGLSSNLLDSGMLQLRLVKADQDVLSQQLDEILRTLERASHVAIADDVEAKEALERAQSLRHIPEDGPEENAPPVEDNQVNMSLGIDVAQLQDNLENQGLEGAGFKEAVSDTYSKIWNGLWSKIFHYRRSEDIQANVALIISGPALETLLKAQKGNPELEHKLLRVARICKVVLACRVSPAQKSLIVEMVRFAPDNKGRKLPITLAIGDGANDVPMIQSAHVGIGISGNEGQQAVNSADFAIAQFRFLTRLLIVHGRWNYRRQAVVINFVIYSWLLYTFLLYAYLPFSLFSGQQIYYSSVFMAVFAYFVNVAIVSHGWMNRDIGADSALRNPWTYAIGVNGIDLNYRKLATLTLRSIIHLLLILFLVLLTSPRTTTAESLGTSVYLAIVLTCIMRSGLCGDTWTGVNVLVYFLILLVFFVFMALAQSPPIIYTSLVGSNVWAGVILTISTVMLVELVVRYATKEFNPSPLDILIEIDRGWYQGSKHARHARLDALNVLEDFTKLTISPITLGARNIKNAVDKANEAKQEREQGASAESGSTQAFGASSSTMSETNKKKKRYSTFANMKPAFDIDMPTMNSTAARVRSFVPSWTRASSSESPESASPLELDEATIAQNEALLKSAASRIQVQQYEPGLGPGLDLGALEEIEERPSELGESKENNAKAGLNAGN